MEVDHDELRDFQYRLQLLTRPPRVTQVLVGLNVLVFALMAIAGAGVFEPNGEAIVHMGSNFGPLTMGAGQWWRLFTATFIHFGIIHLAFNMWALYSVGLTTERLYGSLRFALLYVFAGLTGSLASLWWNPSVNSAGASGAIFGVIGGLIAFAIRPDTGVPKFVMLQQRNSALLFAAYNLFFGAASKGIDNAAHIGGLLGGFLIGLLLTRPLDARRLAGHGAASLAGVIAAAVLFLALAVQPLLHPAESVRARQAFALAMFDLDSQQALAIAATDRALDLGKASTPDAERAAALALRDQAAPIWAALYTRFDTARLPAGDPDSQARALLLRYLGGRRSYCELMARSILENDADLQTQAQAAADDAEIAVKQLNAENDSGKGP